MDNSTPEEKIRNLEALVASLTELLDVQEKVVAEQSERLKRDEEVLKKSEDRYRTLAEASPDQIFIVDEDDTIRYVNSTAQKLFRRSYDQLVGVPRKELFPPDIADTQGIRLQEVFKTGEIVHSEDRIRFGQEELWLSASLVPLKDESGRVTSVLGIARDITRQKKAEMQIREQMKALQAFYGLAEITEKEGITLDQLCQEFAEILPTSWQYAEVACARIVIGEHEYHTDNFRESAWMQSAPIRVHGSEVGKISVGYLDARPARDEGPFLKEERRLINALAERLGRIVERVQDEKALEESNDRFFTFINEAAMRLRNPLEVVEDNLANLVSDIEKGDAGSEKVTLVLRVQIRNVEQIRDNINELNKAIVSHIGEISEASRKFLTE